MTTSDKPEQQSSNGSGVETHVDPDAPPWQRIGEGQGTERMAATGGGTGPVFGDAGPLPGGPAADGAPHDAHSGEAASDAERDQEERPKQGSKRGGATPSALRRPGRGPRRANLQVRRFDPWSVLKLSLVFGLTMFFIWLVAVGVLYIALEGMGVWDQINGMYSSLVEGTDVEDTAGKLISPLSVFGVAAVIGAVNIVLFSALATVGSFIYNVCADMAGGLEVTLSERD